MRKQNKGSSSDSSSSCSGSSSTSDTKIQTNQHGKRKRELQHFSQELANPQEEQEDPDTLFISKTSEELLPADIYGHDPAEVGVCWQCGAPEAKHIMCLGVGYFCHIDCRDKWHDRVCPTAAPWQGARQGPKDEGEDKGDDEEDDKDDEDEGEGPEYDGF